MSDVYLLSDEAPLRDPRQDSLAATLASRICHDLTSPLGAIANGVELMILSGVERTPEMDLIAGSIESANARIRFFRLAYGSASPQPIARAEVLRTLEGLARGSRTSYDWKSEGDHPRIEVKAVFLLLQCLEAALPMGGRLQISQHEGSWMIRAEGPRMRLGLPAWQILSGRDEQWPEGSAIVQFALLAGVLASLGRSLILSENPDRIEAWF